MKKKILLVALMVALFVCIFAISVSADELFNYASVKLTFVDGTEATGYCKIDGRFLRDDVYKNPQDTSEGTYSWGDIKVFDMRNSVIVGNKTYNEVGGLNCNSQAVNVEEYYFSSQVTKILNTTFTSGWKKLKTVYVPNTVTVIDDTAFKESPVEQVIFEEGSQLQSIGRSAFEKCANLTNIAFPEGLQSLGYNCFWDAGLSGTIVIPNSVTYLAPGSLLSTKIENLYLGDGALEIGHNFLGTYQKTDNAYLRNVYIPATTVLTVDGGSKIFFKCANPVNFYIVGSDDECAAMITTLKSHSTGSYMTFITEDEVTESTGAGYGIIHTGYNRCAAFYNNEHSVSNGACTRCGMAVYCDNPEHNLKVEISYTDYMQEGTRSTICLDCNTSPLLSDAPALFKCVGYSAPEGEKLGIAIEYKVNKDAIKEYEEATGKTFSYGVFAVSKTKLGDNEIFTDGVATSGVISTELSSFNFTTVVLKITGFKDEHKTKEFALGVYTSFDGAYGYIQENATVVNNAYVFTSYNAIIDGINKQNEVA